jgi:hypothetical protein
MFTNEQVPHVTTATSKYRMILVIEETSIFEFISELLSKNC